MNCPSHLLLFSVLAGIGGAAVLYAASYAVILLVAWWVKE